MLSLVEVLNYRCLRYVRQPLERFHVLVGPNASGKTTFLDVAGFISDYMSDGLTVALEKRTPNFIDLLFGRKGARFEFAVEIAIPDSVSMKLAGDASPTTCRFELVVAVNAVTQEVGVEAEVVRIRIPNSTGSTPQRQHRDGATTPPETLVEWSIKGVLESPAVGSFVAISRTSNGSTNYRSEVKRDPGKGFRIRLVSGRSALSYIPDDEDQFPVSTWLKQHLSQGIQTITLDGRTLRSPSPPNQSRLFRTDASNLPWVVDDFRNRHPSRFNDWKQHLREALPNLKDIDTIEQEWDKHRYLTLEYDDGLKIPSWTASDGTLRLLALTLPAFLPDLQGVFLIEEPENGLHPRAIETLYQALSNVYGAQVLVATHSPVLLGLVDPSKVLCFAKDDSGATDIVRGDEHPMLADWQRDVALQDYFVAGVL